MDGINTNNQQGGSNMGGSPIGQMSPQPENHNHSTGPIIGSIVVVLVVVLGGLYLYGQQISQNDLGNVTQEQINNAVDNATASLEKQGATDNLNEINSDLNSAELNNLDAELGNVGSELNI